MQLVCRPIESLKIRHLIPVPAILLLFLPSFLFAQAENSNYFKCDSLHKAGAYEASIPYCLNALTAGKQNAEDGDTTELYSAMMLAYAYHTGNRIAEAIDLYKTYADFCLEKFGYNENYIWLAQQLTDAAIAIKDHDLIIQSSNEVIKSRIQVNGEDDPGLVYYYYSAAEEYLLGGEYANAQKYYHRAGDIYKMTVDTPDAQYARILVELSSVYLTVGKYRECIETNKEALRIIGDDTTQYAIISDACQLLSWGYYRLDSVETALTYVQKIIALSAYQEPLAKASTLVSASLFIVNTDITYGQHIAKEVHLDSVLYQALAIYDSLQPDAIFINNVYLAMGLFYTAEMQYDSSAVYYKRSSDLIAATYGKTNIIYLNAITSLANMYEAGGNITAAAAQFDTLLYYSKQFLRSNFIFLSESEQESILSAFNTNRNMAVAFYNRNASVLPGRAAVYYDLELFMKGILLQNITALRNSILEGSDADAIDAFNNWISLKKQIASAAINNQKVPEDIIKKEEALELQLREDHALPEEKEITWKDVQKQLKEEEAAVEFLHFTDGSREMYFADILRKDLPAPVCIQLFSSDSIAFLNKRPGETKESYIQRIYTYPDPAFSDDTLYNDGDQLYKMIWEPLEPWLSAVKTIYVSPSGLLHQIAFNAIASDNTVLLIDRFDLIKVNSTKFLTGEQHEKKYKDFQLVGGIHYSGDRSSGNDQPAGDGRTNYWNPLPGTLTEVMEIESEIRAGKKTATIISGDAATELYFKNPENTKTDVMHFATHGFAYDNSTAAAVAGGGSRFKQSQNPLIRTGLVLSGGNDSWNLSFIENSENDGILTAYEISNMHLSDVSLVVLSACETGLGEVKGSEGVYGLQRAFKMAGVQNLIISLWQVPDNYTAELMSLFYAMLVETNDPQKALRMAQLQMKKKTGVYDWAAFVLIE